MRSPIPKSIAAIVTFLLPCAASVTFSDRVMEIAAPPTDTSGPLRDVVRWGGLAFVQCDTRTWWTADAGRSWKHRDWFADGQKGRVPSLDKAWFTRAAGGLWLGNRNGPLAWAFDTTAGAWVVCPFGRGVVASAGSGDRLYALTGGHSLRSTRDAGVTWDSVPLPDSVRVGTFFDDVQADGERVILRVRDLANSQRPAVTLDGGATWSWLPAYAPTILAQGCAFAAGEAQIAAICPDSRPPASTPFTAAQALFTETGGILFAWADSMLYVRERAAPMAWSVLASAEELRGWGRTRDILYCLRGGALSWFTGAAAAASIHPTAPRAGAAAVWHHGNWCMWRGLSFDARGRNLPRPR